MLRQVFCAGCAFIAWSAQAAEVMLTLQNESSYYFQAGQSQLSGGGYLTDALADMSPGMSSTIGGSHNWYSPLWVLHLSTTFYLLDNNFNPREECRVKLDTPASTLGDIHLYAACTPNSTAEYLLQSTLVSPHIHFDEQSIECNDSIVSPQISLTIRDGKEADIDRVICSD